MTWRHWWSWTNISVKRTYMFFCWCFDFLFHTFGPGTYFLSSEKICLFFQDQQKKTVLVKIIVTEFSDVIHSERYLLNLLILCNLFLSHQEFNTFCYFSFIQPTCNKHAFLIGLVEVSHDSVKSRNRWTNRVNTLSVFLANHSVWLWNEAWIILFSDCWRLKQLDGMLQ